MFLGYKKEEATLEQIMRIALWRYTKGRDIEDNSLKDLDLQRAKESPMSDNEEKMILLFSNIVGKSVIETFKNVIEELEGKLL